jgi:hypothetical protein
MTTKEAEQTLSVIRTLMERSTLYSNLSSHAGIAAGLVTLIGSALRAWADTPFYTTWLCVFVSACAASVFFTGRMHRLNGEPVWTRQAKTVVMALVPSFLAAVVLTAVLSRIGQEALLPGVWMLLWGVGALTMSFFTPRVISLLGITFIVAGTATLFYFPGTDAVSMGLTFGAIHLIYGAILAVGRYSTRVAQPACRY